jgi:uracil-DNA glycosylase
MADLASEAAAARACTLCAEKLPLGPRPILQVSATARLLLTSQAPGTKAHLSGVPFNDASGVRLREWMQIDAETFYDASRLCILPMGLCYPGALAQGGDRPPMQVCAPTWHTRLLPLMPKIETTLLVGTYAQAHLLGPGAMTARVRNFRDYLPRYFPLPHPSWRTVGWQARNPWFEAEVLPELRARVLSLVSEQRRS